MKMQNLITHLYKQIGECRIISTTYMPIWLLFAKHTGNAHKAYSRTQRNWKLSVFNAQNAKIVRFFVCGVAYIDIEAWKWTESVVCDRNK